MRCRARGNRAYLSPRITRSPPRSRRRARCAKRHGCDLESCASGKCVDAATTSEEGIAHTRVRVGARTQPSVSCGDGLVAPKNVYVFYYSNVDSRAKYRRSRLNTPLPLPPPSPSAYVTGTTRDKPSPENQLMNLQVVHSHWQLTSTSRDQSVRRPRSILEFDEKSARRSERGDLYAHSAQLHARVDALTR